MVPQKRDSHQPINTPTSQTPDPRTEYVSFQSELNEIRRRAGLPLKEDPALRTYDPDFVDWLNKALSRPDADQLYLHGNRQGDLATGPKRYEHQLLYFSKLTDPWFRDRPFQAEYYGDRIYLAKLHYHKFFNVFPEGSEANKIATAVINKHRPAYMHGDRVNRVYWTQIQDIIPEALKHGYDFFQVYEDSVRTDSWAVPSLDQVEIVDRYISHRREG